MFRSLVFMMMLLAAPVWAGEDRVLAVAKKAGAAFEAWAAEQGVTRAAFVIRHNGVVLHQFGIGQAADAPVELASLGKAITAVCAISLIRDGHWTAQTTSREVLGYGRKDITVAQLITHSSGLRLDSTQKLMMLWLGDPEPRAQMVARLALKRPGQITEARKHRYNNENYAILGAMIEVETGRPYADFCRARALDPAGVTRAEVSDLTGSTVAWGGWRMPVQDYAAFHDHWFGADGLMRREIRDLPWVPVWGPVHYGAGMYQREAFRAVNFWHFGAWCLPGRLAVGSYAAHWRAEWGLVVAYDACVEGKAMEALDQALVRAVYER